MKTLMLAALAAMCLFASACESTRTTRVEDGTTVMEAETEPTTKANTAEETEPELEPRKGRSKEELEALGYDIGRTLYGKD